MENKVVSFTPRESDKIRSHRKEKAGLWREYAVLDLATGNAILTLRIYWPASVAYACVWVHGQAGYARGAGRAGGGGYCKASAAAGAALADAGIKLEHAIDGRGLEAISGALSAFALHCGVLNHTVHVAHA